MTNPQPPPQAVSKAGLTEWAVDVLRSLTFNNILVLGLLALVAVPSYAAYKFLTDRDFRQEFLGGVRIIDADIPCLVYEASIGGQSDRTYVAVGYLLEGRLEHLIAIRTQQGLLSGAALAAACDQAVAEARVMRAATREEKQ